MTRDLWGEGRWIDMWSLVHLLSGFCLGTILYEFDVPLGWSFAIFSLFSISWELLEYIWKWEKITNHLSDFFVNYLGYAIFYEIYYVMNKPLAVPVVILINASFLALNIWGFRAYKKRKNRG